MREIDACDPASIDIEKIVADGEPVLLRGYCRHWRAYRTWDLSIFECKKELARSVLPVSLDNEEQQSRTRKINMTVHEYALMLRKYEAAAHESADSGAHSAFECNAAARSHRH